MASGARTRNTEQRRIVFEMLRSTKSHPTADWIFEQARLKMPKISLGTVYRNLNVLHNEGLVREIHGMDRKAHFDADTSHHSHFVCTRCGRIRDVMPAPELEWRSLKDLVGCEVERQEIQFFGVCPSCRRRSAS